MLSGQYYFGQKGQSYCSQRGQSCLAKGVKVAWLFQQPRERACTNDHHDLLLENLLIKRNALIINTYKKQIEAKGTNWKQKFQKSQNENVCVTYLDSENKGNFHFMSFRRGQSFYNIALIFSMHTKQLVKCSILLMEFYHFFL